MNPANNSETFRAAQLTEAEAVGTPKTPVAQATQILVGWLMSPCNDEKAQEIWDLAAKYANAKLATLKEPITFEEAVKEEYDESPVQLLAYEFHSEGYRKIIQGSLASFA